MPNACDPDDLIPIEDLPVFNLVDEELESWLHFPSRDPFQLKEIGQPHFEALPRLSSLVLNDRKQVVIDRLKTSTSQFTILSAGHFMARDLIPLIQEQNALGVVALKYFVRQIEWLIHSARVRNGRTSPPEGTRVHLNAANGERLASLGLPAPSISKVHVVDINSMAPGAEYPAPMFLAKTYLDSSYSVRVITHPAVHEMATWSNVNSLIMSAMPVLIRGCGHGDPDHFYGFDPLGANSEVLLKAGDTGVQSWVKDRIVHLFACEAALKLGVDLVDLAFGNAKAFFGYCDRIMLYTKNGPMIADSDHVIDASLAIGLTAEEAEKEFIRQIELRIADLAASPYIGDHELATDLQRLRSSLVRTGDPNATL